MSAERTVPAAPARRAIVSAHDSYPPLSAQIRVFARLAAALVVAVSVACRGQADHILMRQTAPDQRRVALVALTRCGSEWCERLLIGANEANPTAIVTLPPATERVSEIAWAKDGRRVAFLVNGHQLRIYDSETRAPAGQVALVPADATPPTRIARGVTFSDNGAAITFDDCPRDRSGCRPGLVAMR
jgi:hypothetical protein